MKSENLATFYFITSAFVITFICFNNAVSTENKRGYIL